MHKLSVRVAFYNIEFIPVARASRFLLQMLHAKNIKISQCFTELFKKKIKVASCLLLYSV